MRFLQSNLPSSQGLLQKKSLQLYSVEAPTTQPQLAAMELMPRHNDQTVSVSHFIQAHCKLTCNYAQLFSHSTKLVFGTGDFKLYYLSPRSSTDTATDAKYINSEVEALTDPKNPKSDLLAVGFCCERLKQDVNDQLFKTLTCHLHRSCSCSKTVTDELAVCFTHI